MDVVVVADPGVVVVVVPNSPGEVVVVVVVEGVVEVVLVLVLVDELVVLVVVEVGVEVVVVVVVVCVPGDPVKRFLIVGPLPVLPKIEANGLSAINSTAVTNKSASTNTTAAVPAMACQVNFRPRGWPSAPATRPPSRGGTGGTGGTAGTRIVDATRRSVAGASVAAEICTCLVSSADAAADSIWVVSSPGSPTTSVGAALSPDDDAADTPAPAAPVPPSRRSSVAVDPSGTRTTTCLTAL